MCVASWVSAVSKTTFMVPRWQSPRRFVVMCPGVRSPRTVGDERGGAARNEVSLDTSADLPHDHVVRWVVIIVISALTACSFVSEQVGISSASACIRKECRDPDATDYTRCEASCRQRYQR